MRSSAQRGAVAPVRFGLVGYGFGARYFHAPLIASATECQLVAVATRSAERRALVATEHPDAAVVDDLARLVAAGAEAITVSTPADTHIPLCSQALERGLPVVVDKPFALTAADARPAVELAERLGLALSVYQNRRWDSVSPVSSGANVTPCDTTPVSWSSRSTGVGPSGGVFEGEAVATAPSRRSSWRS